MASKQNIFKSRTAHKVVWVLMFAFVGVLTLFLVRAVTPFVTTQAEDGVRSGNVSLVSDTSTGASGTGFVSFGTTPPPPTGSCPDRPNLPLNSFQTVHAGLPYSSSYGTVDIQFALSNPCILYTVIADTGMYKSLNAGTSWTKIGTLNSGGGLIRVNPTDPNHLYTVQGVRGYDNSLGFWVSRDGGSTWTMPQGFINADSTVSGGRDLYGIAVDPNDFNHILVTSHTYEWYGGSQGAGDTGILESKDGGQTWRVIFQPGWSHGNTIFFLDNASSWLLATQDSGFFRTTNAGATWSQVYPEGTPHGGSVLYRSPVNSALYIGVWNGLIRSTNNGASWTYMGSSNGLGYAPYYGAYGDGKNIYASVSFTGTSGRGLQPYLSTPEANGTTWTTFNANQTFVAGPFNATYDSANGIIYFANWQAGIVALRTK